MRRNAPGCRATGRCLQGCPSGGKLSMEASYVPRAMQAGVRVLDRHRARRIVHEGGRAIGVEVVGADGRRRIVRARRAVVVAAGTIRSPLLLRGSGLGGAHAGRHFQCHLGVGALGLLPRPVREMEGPPQGIEVFEFEPNGIKLATQLLPPELLLARTGVTGPAMADLLRAWTHLSAWTVSVRSRAEGDVSPGFAGPSIRFTPAPEDIVALRDGLHRVGQLLAALGAGRFFPNVAGLPVELRADDVDRLRQAPLDPRAYTMAVGHVFGTCRMGSDPRTSVVAPDFRVHGCDGLYVVDASVFPTAIGVNPQLAVMTLARHAALGLAGRPA
jgi:choline dehydrogenase-like flavoprotein